MAVPVKLSLDVLLQMSGCQVREALRKLGSSSEESSRLSAALSCLRGATESGGEVREDGVPWICEPPCRDSAPQDQLTSASRPPCAHSPSPPCPTPATPPAPLEPLPWNAFTPPVTPPLRRHALWKRPQTPPPPPRTLLQFLPNISLPRSRSQEAQLAHRIHNPAGNKCAQKNALLLNVQVNGGGYAVEDPASRSPLPSYRSPTPGSTPSTVPATPTLPEEHVILKNNLALHRKSPQTPRRDIGLAVTHRFSTKSWLSQTCQVCQKNMMFGVKCKHCRLKCHNKCTKEAPSCRISFLPITKMRRAESVPSDINNQVDRLEEAPQFDTLPKALTKKDLPPTLMQLDSSSNPSSTTSSTPSSPAPFQQCHAPSATPPPNPSPKGPRDNRFHFPATCYFQHRQQFIFPDVSSSTQSTALKSDGLHDVSETDSTLQLAAAQQEAVEEVEEDEEVHAEEEEPEEGGGGEREGRGAGGSDAELDGDELEELLCWRGGVWRGPIARKASQTSVYLQEWDVPFEQLALGELIGRGRWGKVHKGRWHGEVAVRLLEIDGNNQDHLRLFKKEVMNYRQTRHENVVLFMGACMDPPHLAIITSFCKGRTLYSVVRDAKNALDINKTRQIAQEIVKGMGYLHAKGIVHKDLKSKNVFHDMGKVVITDFGLFGMSGVVQEGRRENELRLPQGWVCYLAPEIVQRLAPGSEDRLPFSNAADVYAFGTIWYELQARDWPFTNQPVEATIWQVGSGQGIRNVLAQSSLGKEVTEILSACWSYNLQDRPSFTQLADMLERLPKLNRRLSHPGHFWKSAERLHHHCLREHCSQGKRLCPFSYKEPGLL
ncbi:kinase suppressor of Ras 1-like isoform X2 [Conger conger]|uniref:kinase suppressor of Ras 1-like isoform X2 n=1 Tax=Conger conger TaxID=82655 RepID=UPI002A59D854|nr:kinase suppressor of Ras 1-like isoform X2 [Conger conger]